MFDTNASIENLKKFGVGRRRLEDDFFSCDRVPARLGIYDEDEEDSCHQGHRSRYGCGACGRALAAARLLELHVQETHDSYFAAAAARAPSYCCYIQECTDKFANAEERLEHCIKVHKLPKDFRFEIKPKKTKTRRAPAMDVDTSDARPHKFFHNSRRRGLTKYTGKTFTSDRSTEPARSTSLDEIMSDLRQNLPT